MAYDLFWLESALLERDEVAAPFGNLDSQVAAWAERVAAADGSDPTAVQLSSVVERASADAEDKLSREADPGKRIWLQQLEQRLRGFLDAFVKRTPPAAAPPRVLRETLTSTLRVWYLSDTNVSVVAEMTYELDHEARTMTVAGYKGLPTQ